MEYLLLRVNRYTVLLCLLCVIIKALHVSFRVCNPMSGDILPAHNETHNALY